MKSPFPYLKKADWTGRLKRNAYPILSVLILGVYFWMCAAALFFVVNNVRRAFELNEEAARSQVTTFDLPSLEKVKLRFHIE